MLLLNYTPLFLKRPMPASTRENITNKPAFTNLYGKKT